MIDLENLRARIDAVHNGTLPADAVSPDELRAALDQLRSDRRRRATAVLTPRAPDSRQPTLSTAASRPGGLLAMAAAADAEDAVK